MILSDVIQSQGNCYYRKATAIGWIVIFNDITILVDFYVLTRR